MKGRTYRLMDEEPLFAFGHGLSFTNFKYGKAKTNKKKLKEGEVLTMNIPVHNVGKMDGDEVVQVYLKRPSDKEGPKKALRSFKRVNITNGKKENVTIELPYEAFEWFDVNTNTMRPIPGGYEMSYGGSSNEKDLKTVKVQIQ